MTRAADLPPHLADGMHPADCSCQQVRPMTTPTPDRLNAAVAAALLDAKFQYDWDEDVDRLIAELAKRGYRLASDEDDDAILRAVSEARRDATPAGDGLDVATARVISAARLYYRFHPCDVPTPGGVCEQEAGFLAALEDLDARLAATEPEQGA